MIRIFFYKFLLTQVDKLEIKIRHKKYHSQFQKSHLFTSYKNQANTLNSKFSVLVCVGIRFDRRLELMFA